jgi:hypothetical protein
MSKYSLAFLLLSFSVFHSQADALPVKTVPPVAQPSRKIPAEQQPEKEKREHIPLVSAYFVTGGIPTVAYGGVLGIYLSPKSQLELGFEHSAVNENGGNIKHWRTPLRFRGEVAQSFFLAGGIAYDSFLRNRDVPLENDTTSNGLLTFTQHSLEVEAQLGHRWTFNPGFSIGVDWIGYAYGFPLSQKNSSQENLDPGEKEKEMRDFELRQSLGSLHFLKLHLGWVF